MTSCPWRIVCRSTSQAYREVVEALLQSADHLDSLKGAETMQQP
ncbi:hypothetical protein ACWC4D_07975 [Streptomyces sp. NPDC001288]